MWLLPYSQAINDPIREVEAHGPLHRSLIERSSKSGRCDGLQHTGVIGPCERQLRTGITLDARGHDITAEAAVRPIEDAYQTRGQAIR